MFSLQQNCRRGQNRLCLEAKGVGGRGREKVGEMAQAVYAHVSK
jgi:hypothetical protein